MGVMKVAYLEYDWAERKVDLWAVLMGCAQVVKKVGKLDLFLVAYWVE